ncbi:MAG: trimeric intracellular cation channel family protein [Pseudomonadales bacterium]
MSAFASYIADIIGVAVFATTGALVASRKQLDLIGFAFLATATGIGGGTFRDVILGREIFWVQDQTYVIVCLAIATITFFSAHLIQRRYTWILWLDAIGLSAYGVFGAYIALSVGATELVAVLMGMMTASFGGVLRDVVAQEKTLILTQEIYASAAMLAAVAYIAALSIDYPQAIAAAFGIACGFTLRAGALLRGWKTPRYKPRAGRKYE